MKLHIVPRLLTLVLCLMIAISVPSSQAYYVIEGEWAQIDTSTGNPGRRLHTDMVYVSDHDVFVLFGGLVNYYETGDLNDTWVYNASTGWENKNPTLAPDTRAEHAMVYDPVNDLVVLFGGSDNDGITNYNDTWTYNLQTNTWTNVTPATSPVGRYSHDMVYDHYSGKILLYGGLDHQNNRLNDTWHYDVTSNSWEEIYPSNTPTSNAEFSLSYDTDNDVIILFGGADAKASQNGISYQVSNETWYFDPTTLNWNLLAITGDNLSELRLRYRHQSVYLPGTGTMVFGGYHPGTPGYMAGDTNSTWILDFPDSRWTQVNYTSQSTILAIHDFAMASNPGNGTVMIFGGQTNSITDANYQFNITSFEEYPDPPKSSSQSSSPSSTPPPSSSDPEDPSGGFDPSLLADPLQLSLISITLLALTISVRRKR